MAQPTTSSYALLGLLAIRPWTGYELTRQATRSLRFAWPKSERLLYAEPKKLVQLGWATTHRETVAGRERNVYEITDEGRRALEEWLAVRPAPPQLEAEALIRILFAEFGSLDEASGSLRAFREDAADLRRQVQRLMQSYLDDGHPFEDRAHLSVLFATFQVEFFTLVERWTDFADAALDGWESTADVGLSDDVVGWIDAMVAGRSLLDDDGRALEPEHRTDASGQGPTTLSGDGSSAEHRRR